MNIENNKIIAEFMGWEVVDSRDVFWVDCNPKNEQCPLQILSEVFKDWNCLMEIVEKIESLGNYGFTIYRKTTNINGLPIELANTRKSTKIEAVYNACLEFINWYNLNK